MLGNACERAVSGQGFKQGWTTAKKSMKISRRKEEETPCSFSLLSSRKSKHPEARKNNKTFFIRRSDHVRLDGWDKDFQEPP